MIVSSRIVKPHIVKKWAMPGTVHLRSLRWPATSVTSASAFGRIDPRVRSGAGFPERMRRDSQWKRRPAMRMATTVMATPMMILTGTGPPRALCQAGGTVNGRPGGRALQYSRLEILGIAAGGRPPLALVLRAEARGTVGALRRGAHAQEADLADLHA